MRRNTKLDRLATAFADSVAAGQLDEAEGWLATAFLAADRADCAHTLETGRRACAECRVLEPVGR
ncbi:MAG: hypothetical protein WEA54_02990 [Actinomycetota bacterium]